MKHDTRGILLVLTSAFFYASYGIWSRLMSGHFGEFSQAWTRGLLLLASLSLYNIFCPFVKKISRNDWKWFGIIALAGGINQAPYFLGFEHLPIGTATLLFYASLVVGGYILGKIFAFEKLQLVKWVSLALAISGMVTIYHLTLLPSQLFPASMTILSGLLGAVTVILPRKLTSNYSESQIMVGYFACQVVFNYPLSTVLHNPLPELTSPSWIAQLGYALSMFIANLSAIAGYSRLDPSIGSLVGMAEILFGFFFGLLFFGEVLTLNILIGSGLIVLAAVLPHLLLRTKG